REPRAARRTRRDVSTAETITWMNALLERPREGGMRAPLRNHGHNPVAATNRHGRCGRVRPHNATRVRTDKTGRNGFAATVKHIHGTPRRSTIISPSVACDPLARRSNRYRFASLDPTPRDKVS